MSSKRDYEIYICEIAKKIVLSDSSLSNEDILRFSQAIAQYKSFYGGNGLSKLGIYVGRDGFNKFNIYIIPSYFLC